MNEIKSIIASNIIILLATFLILIIGFFWILKLTTYKKYNDVLEKIFILIIFISSPITKIVPFSRLNPGFLKFLLLGNNFNLAIWVISIPFYLCFFIIVLQQISRNSHQLNYKFGVAIQQNFCLWMLVFLGLISPFWSQAPDVSFAESLSILLTSCLATYVAVRYSWQDISFFLRWGLAITSILSVCYAILVPSLGTNEKGWVGIFVFPIFLGMTMALSSILWSAHGIVNTRNITYSLGFASLSILVLLSTNSASGILMLFLLGFLPFLLLLFRHTKAKYRLALTFWLASVSVLAATILPKVIGRILEALGRSPTLTGRTEFWPMLIEAIMEKPLLGYGCDGFWQPWRGIDNPAINIRLPHFIPTHAHNGLLDLGLSLGIIGLVLFALSFQKTLTLSLQHAVKFRAASDQIPLLLTSFVFISSLSESGPSRLFGPTSLWFYYVLCSIKLSVDKKQNSQLKLRSYTSLHV